MTMTKTTTSMPAWVELATDDPAAAQDFYRQLLGWDITVSDDPQYGGYAMAHLGDGAADVAGITKKMMGEAPTAWNLYFGTEDADALSTAVTDAGGTVIAPAFDVGDMGRMAVFADPSGAVFSAWQSATERRFRTGDAGTYGWAELNARGLERAVEFYRAVFGWTATTTPMGDGLPDYTTFQHGEDSVAGALEMQPEVPAQVPSYWMIYFNVDDVDAATRTAIDAGAIEMVAPTPMPGGRFSIVTDPQGAMFGLLKLD